MKAFTIGPNEDSMRLSRFVLRVTRGLPGPLLYKSFRNRRVKVNGRRAAPETCLAAGDVVELYLNDEFFPPAGVAPPAPRGPLPAYGTEYEDEALAILYKPPGVLCHRGAGNEASLLDAFTAALRGRGEYNPAHENTFAPALCNRLDRGTEGLVIAAKRADALRAMNEALREGLVQKTYLCVCNGAPPAGVHRAFLLRDRQAKMVKITLGDAPGAKAITTELAVLQQAEGLSLCRVVLHTGRTHQIRAHLAFLGAPVLGDAKYGKKAANAAFGLHTQLLCAHQLDFAKEMPPGPLKQLAGKCFTARQAQLPSWWREHSGHAIHNIV